MRTVDQPRTLSKLVRRLSASGKNSKNTEVKGLGKAASIAIYRKRTRFNEHYGIYLPEWDETIKAVPEQIGSFQAQEDFRLLLKRDVEISYEMLPRQEVIYCVNKKLLVPIARNKGRLIMKNPLKPKADGSLSIESWARASSKSKRYNKHLSTSTAPKKSKYLRGINVEKIEFKLYNSAAGVLAAADRLFLYGYFDAPIGLLPDKKKTQYVVVQCERMKRNKGRGYFVEIHSYPYSQAETQHDLTGAKNLEKLLHDFPLHVADYRLD